MLAEYINRYLKISAIIAEIIAPYIPINGIDIKFIIILIVAAIVLLVAMAFVFFA
ncbi:hypothetical protein D3C73_1613980 [compost metagenome]